VYEAFSSFRQGRKRKKKKEEERKNKKKIHVIVHMACHVGKTTVKRGFGPG
jgi:hypothetical protein